MRRGLVIAGGLVLVLAVVVELAAVPVATRAVGAALGRCLAFDEVQVDRIGRPALPRLLLGRARDVELEASGLRLEPIRVERARLTLPEVALPWASRPPPPAEATLEVALTEADVQDYLADQAPLGLRPVVEFSPGVAALGLEPAPARVRLEAEVRDGVVRMAPAGSTPSWFDALGLDLGFEFPDDVALDQLTFRDGALVAMVRVDVVAGVDGSTDCPGPLGGERLEGSGERRPAEQRGAT